MVAVRVRFRVGRFGGGACSVPAAPEPPAPSDCAFLFKFAAGAGFIVGVAGVGAFGVGADDELALLGPAPCDCRGLGLCCFCGEGGTEDGLCCDVLGPGVGALPAGVPGKGPGPGCP